MTQPGTPTAETWNNTKFGRLLINLVRESGIGHWALGIGHWALGAHTLALPSSRVGAHNSSPYNTRQTIKN